MMKKPQKFTQGDLSRAIRGASAAGMKIERVFVEPDGRIVLISQPEAPDEAAQDAAKLDARLRGGAHGQC